MRPGVGDYEAAREGLRRLHQADRLAHGTAWEPPTFRAVWAGLTGRQRAQVLVGGVLAAVALFAAPWAATVVWVALGGQLP